MKTRKRDGRLDLFDPSKIAQAIEKAARAAIKGGILSDGRLNVVEMAFRAYDPCLACATHCIGDNMPRTIHLYDKEKKLIKVIES